MTNDATRATAEAMPRIDRVAEATVPYPTQEPADEIDVALGRLRVLHTALTADSQKLAYCSSFDAAMIVDEVLGTLDPIRMFLAENEFSNVDLSFLECRRTWFTNKGGTKDGVRAQTGELAALIAEHEAITVRINAYEGGVDDPEIGDRCDKQAALALKICSHRPQTDDDLRLKVEFLRDWAKDTRLDKKEQDALFASMLPEGGAA